VKVSLVCSFLFLFFSQAQVVKATDLTGCLVGANPGEYFYSESGSVVSLFFKASGGNFSASFRQRFVLDDCSRVAFTYSAPFETLGLQVYSKGWEPGEEADGSPDWLDGVIFDSCQFNGAACSSSEESEIIQNFYEREFSPKNIETTVRIFEYSDFFRDLNANQDIDGNFPPGRLASCAPNAPFVFNFDQLRTNLEDSFSTKSLFDPANFLSPDNRVNDYSRIMFRPTANGRYLVNIVEPAGGALLFNSSSVSLFVGAEGGTGWRAWLAPEGHPIGSRVDMKIQGTVSGNGGSYFDSVDFERLIVNRIPAPYPRNRANGIFPR